jgi:D-serine deaminase-like pyridoxal phosphate-dependent protein
MSIEGDMSQNSDYFIIDSGSKTLSSDQGAHGMPGMEGFGLVYPADRFEDTDYEMIVTRLSEEHGVVIRKDFDLAIGSKVRVVPNHSCVVANLLDTYTVLKDGQITEQWDIAARGQVH